MERKEVDTQEFIDHTLLANELMRDPNIDLIDLIDHTGVFPKTEAPTNLTTNGNNACANGTCGYSAKDALSPELNFHNTIFQFVNKHVVDEAPPRPNIPRSPERTRSYVAASSDKEAAEVEFLTLNSSFLNAPTPAGSNNPIPNVAEQSQAQHTAYSALAIEPTVPIDCTDDELMYAPHNPYTTNARKVLPHKKRISRKLKAGNGGYDSIEQHKHDHVVTNTVPLYSCEICGYAVHTQIDFFAHLKQHYEPSVLEQRLDNVPQQQQQQKEPLDMCGLTAQDKLQQEQAKLDQVFHDVQLNFENFHNIAPVDDDDVGVGVGVGVDNVGVNMVIHADDLSSPHVDEKLAANSSPYVPTVAERALKSAVNDVPVPVDDVEFSDTEDMLEGIRNVVDKVSIEDTCDELDLELTTSGMRAPWFTNNNFSDIAFNANYGQLLLPGEPPPPPPPQEQSPQPSTAQQQQQPHAVSIIKAIPSEQLTMNYRSDESLPHIKRTHIDDDVDDVDDDVEAVAIVPQADDDDEPPPPRRTSTPSDEQLQHSPLSINDSSFKFEDVETTTQPTALPPPPASPSPPTVCSIDVNGGGGGDESTSKANKKLFRCDSCARDFNSYNALKYHNHTHTQERAHKCNNCGRSFYTLSALKAHERTHSGEKPFACDHCEAKFRQWGDLKYHKISRHSDIKAHMCEYCGKSFSRKYSLVVHRRIHTSERNYRCEYCDKTFRASSYLLTHIKVHTGEKPYACHLCERTFRVSGDLKRHMRIHNRQPQQQPPTEKKRCKVNKTREEALVLELEQRRLLSPQHLTKSDAIDESEQEILGL